MRNENDMFNAAAGSTVRNIPWSKNQKHREPAFYFYLILALFLAGADAVIVVFRNNLRKYTVNILALIVACLCFAGIAALSYYNYYDDEFDDEGNLHLIRAIIYTVIFLVVAIQGVNKVSKANDNSPFQNGQSQLLGFLRKDGLSDNTIQFFFEPLVLIVLGTTYSLFDIWGGFPLIACGVSIWIKALSGNVFLNNPVQSSINDNIPPKGTNSQSKKRYTAS